MHMLNGTNNLKIRLSLPNINITCRNGPPYLVCDNGLAQYAMTSKFAIGHARIDQCVAKGAIVPLPHNLSESLILV